MVGTTTERSLLLGGQVDKSSNTNHNGNNGILLFRTSTSSSEDLFEPVSTAARGVVEKSTHWFELSRTNFSPDGAPMWWQAAGGRRLVWWFCVGCVHNHNNRHVKPDDLGISTTLWQALVTDLNAIYIRRIRFLLFISITALLLSWPVCDLIFVGRWWSIGLPMVLLLLFLRHELAFTNECLIPLTLDDCYGDDADLTGPKRPKTKQHDQQPQPPAVVAAAAAITVPTTKQPQNSNHNENLHPYYAAFYAVCAKYTEELASHGIRATVSSDEDGATPQRAYLIFQPSLESGSEGLYFV